MAPEGRSKSLSSTRTLRLLRITALAIPLAAVTFFLLDQDEQQSLIASWRSTGPRQPQALSLRAANRALRREQQTRYFPLDAGSGRLGRVDMVRLPSNHPVEDELDTAGTSSSFVSQVSGILRIPAFRRNSSSSWSLFGVYDGHAGWATSAYLRQRLVPAVKQAVEAVTEKSGSSHHTAMRDAFLAVDGDIMHSALNMVEQSTLQARVADASTIAALAPAVAGSCALMAAYNPVSAKLLVACTGDSRAVLGKRQFDGERWSWTAVPLSIDQNGSNPDEIARLNELHPHESVMMKGLVEKGRIFGLMVTRAFGDHRLKFDTDVLRRFQDHFGAAAREGAVTQPYLTAEPEITETVVQKAEFSSSGGHVPGEFVILASDGLWDHISSEDAVYCVDQWLRRRLLNDGTSLRELRKQAEARSAMEREPVNEGKLFHLKDGFAEWTYDKQWTVIEDDNAATHLVRNVLGGRNRSFFRGVLSAYPPMSRNVRDDITVQVIFFGGVA